MFFKINQKPKNIKLSKLCLSGRFSECINNLNTVISNELLDLSEDKEICYVDISDKTGFVKILPTSKYFLVLEKYMKWKKLDESWLESMKYDFKSFDYDEDFNKIEPNFQHMRVGRFINKVFGDSVLEYDVETFVLRYKMYQTKTSSVFS